MSTFFPHTYIYLLHDSFNDEVDLSTEKRIVHKPSLEEKSHEKRKYWVAIRGGWSRLISGVTEGS